MEDKSLNELMIMLPENKGFLYAACASAALGCLLQLMLSILYNRSLNASDRMRSTKLAWLRRMRTRYESGFEWNNRIRNVALFVEKNIGRRKLFGLYLKTWEAFGRLALPFVLIFSVLGAVESALYRRENNDIMRYLALGAVLTVLLLGVTTLANLKEKNKLLVTNLCEYFENTLQGEARNRRREKRLENEAYLELHKPQEEIACAKEQTISHEDRKATKRVEKEGKHLLKLCKKQSKISEKQAKQEAKKLARLTNRQEKTAGKLAKKESKRQKKLRAQQSKEQKRRDKLTLRMQKMQQKLTTAVTIEPTGLHGMSESKKEENARLKRETLKRKVEVTPEEEERILSEVLKEFLI